MHSIIDKLRVVPRSKNVRLTAVSDDARPFYIAMTMAIGHILMPSPSAARPPVDHADFASPLSSCVSPCTSGGNPLYKLAGTGNDDGAINSDLTAEERQAASAFHTIKPSIVSFPSSKAIASELMLSLYNTSGPCSSAQLLLFQLT